jgi:hypothetical protein
MPMLTATRSTRSTKFAHFSKIYCRIELRDCTLKSMSVRTWHDLHTGISDSRKLKNINVGSPSVAPRSYYVS